ncbi:MAG: phosphatidate cytidylyltransferase [Elusimicrobia bacterium]|nr:phosphatidate cytidylyltransferase [Elusimicrobiota bacterium]
MLLPRLLTSIIGIPLVLLSIYWGNIPFFILMCGVVFLALWEYFVLVRTKYSSQPFIGIIMGLCLFLFVFLSGTSFGPASLNQSTAAFLSLFLIPVFAVEMLKKKREHSIETMAVTFFGMFFIPWMLGHLLLLRSLKPNGMLYVFFLFIVIWILDTGAYAVGVRLGKNKLATTVSPKKTVEGTFGGIITGTLSAGLFGYLFLKNDFSLIESLLLGFFISLVSQFSDLAESLIKRDAGVKDSADLLPGHGGMLDRFDSFLFTAPLLYYYLTIFK